MTDIQATEPDCSLLSVSFFAHGRLLTADCCFPLSIFSLDSRYFSSIVFFYRSLSCCLLLSSSFPYIFLLLCVSLQGLNSCLDKATPYEIYSTVNDRSLWTQTITCFSLPPQMDLLMGDVCGGSSSVSMVSGAVLHCLAKPSLMLIILKDTIFCHFYAP